MPRKKNSPMMTNFISFRSLSLLLNTLCKRKNPSLWKYFLPCFTFNSFEWGSGVYHKKPQNIILSQLFCGVFLVAVGFLCCWGWLVGWVWVFLVFCLFVCGFWDFLFDFFSCINYTKILQKSANGCWIYIFLFRCKDQKINLSCPVNHVLWGVFVSIYSNIFDNRRLKKCLHMFL